MRLCATNLHTRTTKNQRYVVELAWDVEGRGAIGFGVDVEKPPRAYVVKAVAAIDLIEVEKVTFL